MDNRKEIKVGDYFNETILKTNGNETWDNQNRFNTCKLIGIDKNGDWMYQSLWYEYTNEQYPFYSSITYWNVFSEYALESCIIEKITDPEVEGFKDKKLYLSELIEKKIKDLKKKYYNISQSIAIYVIKNKVKNDYVSDLIDDLIKVCSFLNSYDVHYYYRGFIDVLEINEPFPKLTGIKDDITIVGNVSKIYLNDLLFELVDNKGFYLISFDSIIPNDKLYPIDFAYIKPWSCIFMKSECESLAQRILYFTESWDNPLTWEEYLETLSSKEWISDVKKDFERVSPYLVSPEKCGEFSKTWANMLQ